MPKVKVPYRISLFGGGTDVEPFCSKYGGLVINFAVDLESTNSGIGNSTREIILNMSESTLSKTKEEIAQKAFEIEINKGWYTGCQDQYACTFGGFNLMKIKNYKEVEIIPLPKEWLIKLYEWLVLFDTGIKRESRSIQDNFKKLSYKQEQALLNIKKTAIEAVDIFSDDYADKFLQVGELLDKAWKEKKESNKDVSNSQIDKIYQEGKRCNAIGGKLLGAGGGGYILFVVPPEQRYSFIAKTNLRYVPFTINWKGLEVISEE